MINLWCNEFVHILVWFSSHNENFRYLAFAIGGTGNLLMLICLIFGGINNSATFFICALSIFDSLFLIALLIQTELEGTYWTFVKVTSFRIILSFLLIMTHFYLL